MDWRSMELICREGGDWGVELGDAPCGKAKATH